MRVVVDSAIPYIRGLLEPFAEVDYREGRAIDTEVCRKADALLVRTRTQCNAALLEGSTVRFIGTATIGTDHIDSTYCAEHGITVVNAPGCNAWAVVQWVVSILAQINQHASFALTERPVGIVGCGAIGERLARLLEIFHIPSIFGNSSALSLYIVRTNWTRVFHYHSTHPSHKRRSTSHLPFTRCRLFSQLEAEALHLACRAWWYRR